MTPAELRAAIPALDGTAYFNTGASGPSPQPVLDAASEGLTAHENSHVNGDPYAFTAETLDQTRERVADFIGAAPGEIALTESTTHGINQIAAAMSWSADDVVVRTNVEHPAGMLPWTRLRDRCGIDVRVLECPKGRIDRAAFRTAVQDARLVCLSGITWTHGTRLPVADLVEIAHAAGARVLVDAVQMVGQVPVAVADWGADYVAAAGHKWLLGPWGAGFLYVNDDVVGDLDPAMIGFNSVEDPFAATPTFWPDARRFEIGTISPAPYLGLQAAIDVIERVGLTPIQDHIDALTEELITAIPPERLLSPTDRESGLVTIDVPDPEATVERLAEAGVIVREIPLIDAIRVSVHAFNTRTDIDALLAALPPMTPA